MKWRLSDERGFSLMELLVIAGIIGVLGGVAMGVSSTIVRMVRGESGAQQLDAFLKRHREMAIARRRDIEIRFIDPNQVQSAVRSVPVNPGDPIVATVLETMTFEGGIEYQLTDGLPDTRNGFGNATPVSLEGADVVMLSSEGAFINVPGDPINATISLGIEGDPLSATAITILGVTASIERWRWNGSDWTK